MKTIRTCPPQTSGGGASSASRSAKADGMHFSNKVHMHACLGISYVLHTCNPYQHHHVFLSLGEINNLLFELQDNKQKRLEKDLH